MIDRLTAKISSRFLSYGLPFLYLLTSIGFYLHTYDSAQVKITIVQMMGTVVIGFWYLTLLSDRDTQWKSYAPIYVPLLAALASGLLSFSHAAYRGPSLDECLRRVFYIHFALIALCEVKTLERLKRMTFYLLVATAIATIYGFIQYLDWRFFPAPASGIDPFVWRQAFGPRIFSTFGNPNFYGNFLVILTPVTLGLILKRKADSPISVLVFSLLTIVVSAVLWQMDSLLTLAHLQAWFNPIFIVITVGFLFWVTLRFSFLGVLFFLTTFGVIVTVSKGAWIGYAAAFVLFWMLVLRYFAQFQSKKLKKSIQSAAWTTLLVCTIGVSIFSHERIDSLRFRVCTWVSTWEMALMHPIWGNGIGSFRIIYPAFRRPQIFHIEAKHNTETDHAEDEYWEVLQDEGIIGFGIFLWVITTFSVLGVRALSRFTEGLSIRDPSSGKRRQMNDPRAFYMLAFLAAFWGMLMHNFMDVSLRFVSSGIFLWLLAGLIGAMVVHDPMAETDAQLEAREKEPDAPEESHAPGLQFMALGITIVLFGFLSWRILTQFNDTQGPMPDATGELLLWVIAWAALLGTMGAVLWALYRVCSSMKKVYGFVVLWAMVYPLTVFWGYFMADVYHNRGIFYSKQQNWEAAIGSYQKVVDLNPNYIMAYYFMGNVYTDRWQKDDVDMAMKQYEKVWAIAPNYVQSHHQAGLVYLKKGQDDRKLFDDYRSKGQNAEAAQALLQTRADWEKALYYFHKYHGIDPVFEPNYSRMGWVHMQLAELDMLQGNAAGAQSHYDQAEAAYQESLGAWVCCDPHNDVIHEHWGQPPMLALKHPWIASLLKIHWPKSIDNIFEFYGVALANDWQNRQHVHYSAEMFENLGNTRFVRGHLPEAVKAYRMSLWVDKTNARVMKNLASVYGRLGRQQDALQMWLRIRALNPQDPDLQRVFHAQPVSTHT